MVTADNEYDEDEDEDLLLFNEKVSGSVISKNKLLIARLISFIDGVCFSLMLH
jgi:hypothetical protein